MMSLRQPLPLILCSLLFAAGFTGGSCGGEGPTSPLPSATVIACASLGEAACLADARCLPTYSEGACDCPSPPPCAPGEDCDGFRAPPPPDECACTPSAFEACIDRSTSCAELGEQACIAHPGCRPVYSETSCQTAGDAAAPCHPDIPDCGRPRPCTTEPTFAYCTEEPAACPEVLCQLACEYGLQTGSDGCQICACNPPPGECEGLDEQACIAHPACEPNYVVEACDPACIGSDCSCRNYTFCSPTPPPEGCAALDEQACIAHPGCEPNYVVNEPDPACQGNDCAALVYTHCSPASPVGECASDADCPNGYCETFASCLGLHCPPPPPSYCVYPSCDDGSTEVCEIVPPTCAPGQTLAIRNSCYACVDARMCQSGSGGTCDAGEVLCDTEPPVCPTGLVASALNGCWACKEPSTCQGVICHDGEPLICGSLPPSCPPELGLALIDGCWACIRPDACH